MPINEDYKKYVLDQLSGFGQVDPKNMFGGVGLFHEGLMFGMIGGDTFKLKVDDTNKAEYESKGMKPHESKSKKKGMPYWEVPVDVLEDKKELAKWANKSYQAALNSKKK